MRVCVLSDETINDFDPGPFLKDHEWEMFTMRPPVTDFLKAIAEQERFDVYLNLCDGYDIYYDQYEYYYEYDYEYYFVDESEKRGEQDDETDSKHEQNVGRAYNGIDVVKALTALNLPYTGADEAFFDPTREEMQAVAESIEVGFAKGYRVQSIEDAEQLVGNLQYPIMVKHPMSYGSTGMLKESKANTIEDVKIQVERVCGRFGAARMEEFIEGREFNVFVVDNPDDLSDPFVYPPIELIFSEGEEFLHKNMKWDWDNGVSFNLSRVTDTALAARLQDMCRKFYIAMKGISYGRCDVRMNEKGELFILEINPNNGIMYMPEDYSPADYMILYNKDGYKGFFDRIFRSAIIRQKMRAG